MKEYISALLLIGTTIYISCNQDRKIILDRQNINTKTLDLPSANEDTNVSHFIKPVDAIPIVAKDSLYTSGALKLVPYKDKYIFGDFELATLLLLDSDGKEISKIGGLGSAADHYLTLHDFNADYNKDQVMVFSNSSRSLYTYSIDGKLIDKNKLGFYAYSFAILDSASLIFFLNQNTNKKSGNYNMLVTDRTGKILQRLFPITKLPHMGVAYSGFILNNDHSILYSEPFSDSIFEVSNYKYGVKYSLPFGEKVFPTSKDMSIELLHDRVMKYNYLRSRVFESQDYIFLCYTKDRRLQPIAINKQTGKSMNGRGFHNKIIENLLYNVCGAKDGIFYSIVDYDILYPILKDNPGDVSEIEKFDVRLHSELSKEFPFKNPVIFAFKFIF